jgi:hypothetical protein
VNDTWKSWLKSLPNEDADLCAWIAAGYTLAFTLPQLNRDHKYGGVVANQLRTFQHIGLVGPADKAIAHMRRLLLRAAKTVAEAGLAPLMTTATAEREDWAAAQKDALAYANDLGAMLDAIRNTMPEGAQAAPKAAE